MKFFKLEGLEFIAAKKAEIESMTGGDIAKCYNAMAKIMDESPVKRFATKPAAIKRLGQLSDRYAKAFPDEKPIKKTATKKPVKKADVKKNTVKKAKKSSGARINVEAYPTIDGYVPDAAALKISRITRANPFANMKIYDLTGKENPRRETCPETNAPARAWLCFNIIIDAGAKGISFENYIEAGGNLRDLQHDLKRGRVSVK